MPLELANRGPLAPSPGANTRPHVAATLAHLPKSPGLPSLGRTLAGSRWACSVSLGPGRVAGAWQVLEKSRSGWGAVGAGRLRTELPMPASLCAFRCTFTQSWRQGTEARMLPCSSEGQAWGSPHTRAPRSVPERPGQSAPTPMWGERGPVPLSEQKLASCQVSTTHASHWLQMSTAGQRMCRGQGGDVSEQMVHLPRPASPPPNTSRKDRSLDSKTFWSFLSLLRGLDPRAGSPGVSERDAET